MPIPKEAIEKAIEGGWKTDLLGKDKNTELLAHNIHSAFIWQTIALDSSFWQALGKALGWGSWYDEEGMPRHHVRVPNGWYPDTKTASGHDEQAWEGVALYFAKLILTGGDTEKFWNSLLVTN